MRCCKVSLLRMRGPMANLAVPKFGLRALAQSMARELAPKGLHVAHVIIDGQIASERYSHLAQERGTDALLSPDAIADPLLSATSTGWERLDI